MVTLYCSRLAIKYQALRTALALHGYSTQKTVHSIGKKHERKNIFFVTLGD